jgi:hypothetical protein
MRIDSLVNRSFPRQHLHGYTSDRSGRCRYRTCAEMGAAPLAGVSGVVAALVYSPSVGTALKRIAVARRHDTLEWSFEVGSYPWVLNPTVGPTRVAKDGFRPLQRGKRSSRGREQPPRTSEVTGTDHPPSKSHQNQLTGVDTAAVCLTNATAAVYFLVGFLAVLLRLSSASCASDISVHMSFRELRQRCLQPRD